MVNGSLDGSMGHLMGQWVTRWVNGSWVINAMGQMGHGSWVTNVDPWSTLMLKSNMIFSKIPYVYVYCCLHVMKSEQISKIVRLNGAIKYAISEYDILKVPLRRAELNTNEQKSLNGLCESDPSRSDRDRRTGISLKLD